MMEPRVVSPPKSAKKLNQKRASAWSRISLFSCEYRIHLLAYWVKYSYSYAAASAFVCVYECRYVLV